jgi:hypothetical protein
MGRQEIWPSLHRNGRRGVRLINYLPSRPEGSLIISLALVNHGQHWIVLVATIGYMILLQRTARFFSPSGPHPKHKIWIILGNLY